MFGLSGLSAKLGEYLIVILVVAGVMFGVYHKGGVDKENEIAVEQAKADKAQQDKYNLLADKYESKKADRIVQTNTITKIVPQIVEREVYKNICIDSQGFDVANKAIRGESYELPK